jgi:hypothetical protein
MFLSKFSLKHFLLGGVLLLTLAAVAAAASNDQIPASSVSAIRTTLQPDLTLKGTLSPELIPSAFHRRTCRCSCGYPCNSDADCGPGGSCEEFISCCDRDQTSAAFQLTAGRSTRTGESAPVAVNFKCK